MADNAMGDYYLHESPYETIKYMEFLAEQWVKNGVPASKIPSLLMVIKYCSPRLGSKGGLDTLDSDLLKIENYAHRARVGGWIPSCDNASRMAEGAESR